MQRVVQISRITFKGAFRDRVLYAVLGTGFLMALLVPIFSSFSMRQVRELSITLSLSFTSLVLLVLAMLLGSTSLWRDIEKRYTATLSGLPLSRRSYLLGRFAGLAAFMTLCALFLAAVGCLVIFWQHGEISAALSFSWLNIFIAFAGDILKYVLLIAVALLFSTVSTSLFLPVFGTLGIYFAGSASQEVIDYLATAGGQKLPAFTRLAARLFYYLVPNFELFNFKVVAIYGLPLSWAGVFYAGLYFLIYTALVLMLAVAIFNRRELP